MKILITGSNGLLGQKLVTLLSSESDIDLVATARGKNRLPQGSYIYEGLDVTNKDEVKHVISQHAPDVIIHSAAMTQVDDCEQNKEACWQINVTGTSNLLEAVKGTNTHFIFVSTDFVFDGSFGPLDEQAVPQPVNYYGECKLASEKLVQQHADSWAIVRTVLVYGFAHDMSRSNIILWVKNSLAASKEIKVVTDQWRTPTLAEDLAMGCYLVAKHKAKGIFHISGKDMLTPYDIAIKTAEFFALDKSLIHKTDGSQFSQPAKRPPKTGFIIEKAKKQLGYDPHSFEEGLAILQKQLEQEHNK